MVYDWLTSMHMYGYCKVITIHMHGREQMNTVRIKGDGGVFEMKGNEPRKNRMLTLTETAWTRLQDAAQSKGMSRSDLVETAAMEGQWSDDAENAPVDVLSKLESALEQLLQDEMVVRPRDRSAVRKAFKALLDEIR